MAFLLFSLERCLAFSPALTSVTSVTDELVTELFNSPHGEALLRTNLTDFFAPILAFPDATVALVTKNTNEEYCTLVKRLIEVKTGFTGLHVAVTEKRDWNFISNFWTKIHPDRKPVTGQQVLFMDETPNDELRKEPSAGGLCVVHCKPYEYRITRRHLDALESILKKTAQIVTDPKQSGILDTFDEDEDEQSLSLVRSFLEQTTRFA